MVRVYSAPTLPDAHLIAALLGQEGIEARVFNENAQGGLGEIPFMHAWPEVWVIDERFANRARELIRALERTDTTSQVTCTACGETNPSNFQLCWNCGAQI
jgi:predicted aconitase